MIKSNIIIKTIFASVMTFAASASNLKLEDDSPKAECFLNYAGPLVTMAQVERFTYFLDADSLDALALTAKSGTILVAEELKRRVSSLFLQLHQANLQNEHPDADYVDYIDNFCRLTVGDKEYLLRHTCPLKGELFALAKPMYSVAVLEEEKYRLLGLQAAELLCSRYAFGKYYDLNAVVAPLAHWNTINDLYTTIDVKNHGCTFDCKYLKKSVAVNLGRMCQQSLSPDPANELNDICYSLIAFLRMIQYPQSLDDVRAAAKSLTKIQHVEHFSRQFVLDIKEETLPIYVLIALQNGSPLHMLCGAGRFIFGENNVNRDMEAKIQDFDLLRTVYMHAKKDLRIKRFGLFREIHLDVDTKVKDWQPFIPALLNDQQAELFKKSEINRNFP